MEPITVYSTAWCPDCRRAKTFLKERGLAFEEVNIEDDPDGEEIVSPREQRKTNSADTESGGALFRVQPVQCAATRRRIEDSPEFLAFAQDGLEFL